MEGKSKSTGIIVGIIVALLVVGGVFWALSRDDDANTNETMSQTQEATEEQQETGNIVVIATETPALSTLVTAVKAANLVETLQGTGPYTVFAPTNEAFDALPEGTLATLLKPENQDQLKAILTYHVVAGEVMAADLQDGQELTTVQGGKLTVKITDGMAYLIDAKGNQIKIEKADVNADNGVVHVIGGVLLPS